MEAFSFSGKHVLITGAGSGIGRLMALGAARRGASHIVLWDLNLAGIKAVAEEISALGVKASTHKVDVSQRASVIAAASAVIEDIGHLDVLVNNAGIVSGKSFLEL